MEDLVYYSILFDYYGKLLTDKEQEYFDAYYFNNLSLQEIADNYGISKAAVSKALKEGKEKLDYYESILHLYQNKLEIEKRLKPDDLTIIEDYI